MLLTSEYPDQTISLNYLIIVSASSYTIVCDLGDIVIHSPGDFIVGSDKIDIPLFYVAYDSKIILGLDEVIHFDSKVVVKGNSSELFEMDVSLIHFDPFFVRCYYLYSM